MNLRIEWHAESITRNTLRAWIRPLFVHRLGWIVIAFIITMAITDSYYLNALHRGENKTYLLGPASFLGLYFTYVSLRLARSDPTRRRKKPPVKDTRVFYVTLTDAYAEKGVIGQRYVRCQWCLFSGFEENRSRFVVKIGGREFAIEKADVQDANQIGQIRELLQSKLPGQARA